jgi:hypothetical protein
MPFAFFSHWINKAFRIIARISAGIGALAAVITIILELMFIVYSSRIKDSDAEVDCPRSGPGPVRPLFADPGPGPQAQ